MANTLSLSYLPVGDFNQYLAAIRSIPRLTEKQEKCLAIRYKEHNDIEAAKQLISSNLRLVVHIAKQYTKYNIPLPDMVQEGNIGLMKAVSRFDPAFESVRLSTYASRWIKYEIIDYIIKNANLIKTILTKAQRKIFFNIGKYMKESTKLTTEMALVMADDLNVDVKDIHDTIARLSHKEIPIETHEDDEYSPGEVLGSIDTDPALLVERDQEAHWRHNLFIKALAQLDARSFDIIKSRKLSEEPMSFKELALKYKVTHQRIEQVEKLAIAKITKYIQQRMGDV